jgi:SAM-dependent methyltransferase
MKPVVFRAKRKLVQVLVAPLLGKSRSWRWLAQRGEFHFHQNDQWRQTDDFYRHTHELFGHFGFSPEAFAGKTVIDLGAGSKLRTKYFLGAHLIAIEPLAERFVETISWCDLPTADRVISRPAEEPITELRGTADLVISINVIDHCYDLSALLENVRDYLKPGAFAFLSFDSHGETDLLHPLELDENSIARSLPRAGLTVERQSAGLGPLGPNYGLGTALNYWLRRC